MKNRRYQVCFVHHLAIPDQGVRGRCPRCNMPYVSVASRRDPYTMTQHEWNRLAKKALP